MASMGLKNLMHAGYRTSRTMNVLRGAGIGWTQFLLNTTRLLWPEILLVQHASTLKDFGSLSERFKFWLEVRQASCSACRTNQCGVCLNFNAACIHLRRLEPDSPHVDNMTQASCLGWFMMQSCLAPGQQFYFSVITTLAAGADCQWYAIHAHSTLLLAPVCYEHEWHTICWYWTNVC